ncbi:MAG: signal peptidase II [Acetobacteraceae bacterium]|nr:signal peptidase II [Acetobacteraceae bacterium]
MALAILLLDQASKYCVLYALNLPTIHQIVVLPFFNLTMVWNRGITFGLLTSDADTAQLIFSALALLAVIAFAVWLWRTHSWWVALAVGAIAGGAIGNVIDRLRFGAVVDFLHVHAWGWSWYVFNIADAAIVCGVAALIAENLFVKTEEPQ